MPHHSCVVIVALTWITCHLKLLLWVNARQLSRTSGYVRWLNVESVFQEPSLFLSWTESDTSDLITRTEIVLKTLAYSLFNHPLWPLTQDSSTDVSNVSVSHSCCHLADDATVSWKACFNTASVWFSLQQFLKPVRIATCRCPQPGFVTFTEL